MVQVLTYIVGKIGEGHASQRGGGGGGPLIKGGGACRKILKLNQQKRKVIKRRGKFVKINNKD